MGVLNWTDVHRHHAEQEIIPPNDILRRSEVRIISRDLPAMDERVTEPRCNKYLGIIRAKSGSVCDDCIHSASFFTSSRKQANLPGSVQWSRWAKSSSSAPQFGQLVCLEPNHRPILRPLAQNFELCLKTHILNISGFDPRHLSRDFQSTLSKVAAYQPS